MSEWPQGPEICDVISGKLILLKNVKLYQITDHWWLDQKVKKLIDFRSRKFNTCHSTLASLTTPASCGAQKNSYASPHAGAAGGGRVSITSRTILATKKKTLSIQLR